ncbi:hypothetical protein DMB42_11415 [Nonomuraea sp. WAC 01424]|uniref:hypothetical protein n=1 Tax=Nonomuraea sp. WAC 01424 TaxID=2203200 RepID=UPI000F7B748A|nr:hypothetical protein [Nonomuraea sp. WAC 01424]RSN12779.1 hypothetical protein DMB42_11415 [Nonomuraea sp. WAC 01424]
MGRKLSEAADKLQAAIRDKNHEGAAEAFDDMREVSPAVADRVLDTLIVRGQANARQGRR